MICKKIEWKLIVAGFYFIWYGVGSNHYDCLPWHAGYPKSPGQPGFVHFSNRLLSGTIDFEFSYSFIFEPIFTGVHQQVAKWDNTSTFAWNHESRILGEQGKSDRAPFILSQFSSKLHPVLGSWSTWCVPVQDVNPGSLLYDTRSWVLWCQ